MPYKLIALDQGGLLTNTGEIPSRNVWRAYGLDQKIAEKIWHQHDEDYFGGKINEGVWWGYFAEKAPNRVLLADVKRIFRESFEAYPANLQFVGELTARKLRGEVGELVTAIWTNNSSEWLDFQKKEFGIQNYVDMVISSHELRITKHHLAFFDAALLRSSKLWGYNFKKDDVWFYDDDQKYITNAQKAGIKNAFHVPRSELLPDIVRKTFPIKV